MKLNRQKFWAWTRLVLLAVVAAALPIVPERWLENLPSICLWRRMFGIKCPGCGMTRAMSHLAHLDFESAWQMNPFVFIVAPILTVIVARQVWKDIQTLARKNTTRGE